MNKSLTHSEQGRFTQLNEMGNLCCPTKYPLSTEAKLREKRPDAAKRPVDDTVVSRPVSRGSYIKRNTDDTIVYLVNETHITPANTNNTHVNPTYTVSEDDINAFFVAGEHERNSPEYETALRSAVVTHTERVTFGGQSTVNTTRNAHSENGVPSKIEPVAPIKPAAPLSVEHKRNMANRTNDTSTQQHCTGGINSSSTKYIVEENRDVHEIWTKLEMIEENICCSEDRLYDDMLENLREISELNDTLMDEQETTSGAGKRKRCSIVEMGGAQHPYCDAATQAYRQEVDANNAKTARALSGCKPTAELKNNTIKQMLAAHKRHQADFRRKRDLQVEELHDKLRSKLDTHLTKSPHGVTGGPLAAENNTQYADDDGDFGNEYSSSECDSSTDSDMDSNRESTDAQNALKLTLTNDIKSRIEDMTPHDFTSLMGLYRKEKQRMSTVVAEPCDSLWTKMADRKYVVDASDVASDDEDVDVTTNIPEKLTDNGTGDNMGRRKASHLATTQTDSDKKLDAALQSDFIARAVSAESCSTAAVHDLFQHHFDSIETLRRQREEQCAEHNANLAARLRKRQDALPSPDEAGEEVCGFENDLIMKKLDDLKQKYCKEAAQNGSPLKRDDVEGILARYYDEQNALLKSRSQQKQALDERLQDRIHKIKSDTASKGEDGDDGEQDDDVELICNEKVVEMDKSFYENLCEMRKKKPLADGDLQDLIGDHMQNVRKFRKSVMMQRREERKANVLGIEEVNSLVNEDKQHVQRFRELRYEEREKTNHLLEEKLRKKKERQRRYADHPELPPRRRSSRHSRKQMRLEESRGRRLVYENVELQNK